MEESEPETTSANSEMNFYRMMDLRLQHEFPVVEEQVLKIRLQSRRKQEQSSPMNREVETRGMNRSCVRERTASGIDEILIEERAEDDIIQRRDSDKDCIVVRTQNVANIRNSVLVSPSQIKHLDSPINLTRFN